MSETKYTGFTADLQLKAIELLNTSITVTPVPNLQVSSFDFNISLENKSDNTSKLDLI